MSIDSISPTLVVTVSGPSGSGKSTLVQGLMEAYPSSHRMRSWTTRPPRGPEDSDYYFCDPAEFDRMARSWGFASTRETDEGKYGAPLPVAGRTNIAIVDPNGVHMIRDRLSDHIASGTIRAVHILLDVPREVCAQRIREAQRLDRLKREFLEGRYLTTPLDRSVFSLFPWVMSTQDLLLAVSASIRDIEGSVQEGKNF